jgi:hypothetical protein
MELGGFFAELSDLNESDTRGIHAFAGGDNPGFLYSKFQYLTAP